MFEIVSLQSFCGDGVFEKVKVGDEPKITGRIHLYVVDLLQEGSGKQGEAFIVLIIPVQPFVRTRPKDMVVVHIKTMDEIIADAGAILRVVAEHLKGISVKTVQPILCAKPKKPLIVLNAGKHRVVRQPIFYLVVSEVIGLTRRTCGEEKQNGKDETVMNQLDRVGFGI